ncbi:MAG TPA: septum formation initiator family protein [bacterium]|nr:septum formation initiator family protein [bacterium]
MEKQLKQSVKARQKVKSLEYGVYKKTYVLLVIGFFVYIGAYFGILHYRNFILMEHRVKEISLDRQQKLKEIKALKEEKIKLHNPEYLQQIARKELYLMKRGEVHIKLVPNPVETDGGMNKKDR